MKFFTPERGWFASLHRYLLCLAVISVCNIGTSLAEESSALYQSTFDDYKSTITDTQADATREKAGHQMSGMQHASETPMHHECMQHPMSHGDAHATHDLKAETSSMDHTRMQGMDHRHMHEAEQSAPMTPGSHHHAAQQGAATETENPPESTHSESQHQTPAGGLHAH